MLLTQAVEFYSNEFGTQAQVWLILGLNIVFMVGFAASAYGLWRGQNWGRLLFLLLIIIWSASNLVAMFMANPLFIFRESHVLADGLVNGLRFGLGLLVSVWYFNLPRIKRFFTNPPGG